jgi:hypothetical protein
LPSWLPPGFATATMAALEAVSVGSIAGRLLTSLQQESSARNPAKRPKVEGGAGDAALPPGSGSLASLLHAAGEGAAFAEVAADGFICDFLNQGLISRLPSSTFATCPRPLAGTMRKPAPREASNRPWGPFFLQRQPSNRSSKMPSCQPYPCRSCQRCRHRWAH